MQQFSFEETELARLQAAREEVIMYLEVMKPIINLSVLPVCK
jgi:hypothetical protein